MTSFVIDDYDPEAGELVEDIRRDVSDSISEKTETWKPKILISEEPFVVHAKWVPKKEMIRSICAKNYTCSHCKADGSGTKYCPNCGAKMDAD